MATYLDARADPWEIAMADFNGDSLVDIATANRYSRTVSVLLAVGGGRFRAARVYPTGGRAESIAVGDLSGDGGPDIAVANTTRDSVSVFISNPDGSLRPVVRYRTGGGPTSVAIGDLNADARADLAVVNWDDVTVSTLLGRGDGTFLPATTYRDDNLGEVYYVAVGDLNADGKTDVAVADIGDAVWVLIGRGDGKLSTAVDYLAGDTPGGVAIGDLNGDRRLDLAVSNVNSSDVSVLLGRGDGTFGGATDYRLGAPFSGTGGAVLADLNGDGSLDIVAGNSFPGNVAVALGRGDGSFARAAHYRAGRNGYAVAVADLNGDALPDLAVANHSSGDASRLRDVAVLLQTTATPPRIDVSGLRRRGCLKQAARIRVQVTSATSLQSVSVFVDRARIARTTRRRFSVTVHAERLRPGRHSLRVNATNGARLEATKSLRFRRCR